MISAFAKTMKLAMTSLWIFTGLDTEDELRELISNKNMNGIINLKGFADRKVISEAMLNSDTLFYCLIMKHLGLYILKH